MKKTIILTALMAFLAIELFATTPKPKANQEKWSIKMADMVMTRWDTLGYYGGRTRAGWSYDVSMVGMAIDQLGSIDPKYSAYMKTYMDMLVDNEGRVARYSLQEYNIDYIKPARNLMILYKKTGEEKYKKAIPQFAQQMETHPKTESGGFWHKKRYPNQVWLDGVYMGMPFLTMYAAEFNEPKWFDVVTHEIKLVYEKTRDPKTGLLYHAWDESKKEKWADPKTGLSPHFWSRAMGWYVMAIVDVLDYLPANHPDVPELKNILKNTLDALLKVRDKKTGCWYQVLDQGGREGNYLEGSGTAMFIYAMAKGSKKGYVDKKYYKIADKAFDQMVKEFIVTGEDGLPDMVRVCGSCGLGGTPYRDGSYQYYITEKIVLNDTKGVGPFILAAIELGK
jgi:unsaturated rhamnogalacturonyl hydrolase